MIENKIIFNNKSWHMFHFQILNSTMAEIKKNNYKKYDNLIIYADSQTEGKGRNNNKWISKKGNLYVSFKFTKLKLRQFFILNYIVGLTIYEAINYYLNSFNKLYIKWPNDIILNDKKVAGNIIELFSIGKEIESAIVGIGINISHSPNNLKYLTTFLNLHTEKKVNIIELINVILEKFSFWENIYYDRNCDYIIKQWMLRSHKIGSVVSFMENHEVIKGIYKGINEDGAIKIGVQNKLVKFYNKEIFI